MRTIGVLGLSRYIFNKHRLRFLLLSFLSFCVVYHVLTKILYKISPSTIPWKDTDFNSVFTPDLAKSEIVILRWTAYWRSYSGPKILDAQQCSNLPSLLRNTTDHMFNTPCRISYDRRYLKVSDALVFHSYDLLHEELPNRRDSKQLWVYLQQECPIYTKLDLQNFQNTFNWTMTYRRDSDVYFPYGHFVPNVSNDTLESHRASLAKKTKLVAWIVSSCDSHSRREDFVEELQKYVPVDIFGWCGQDCPSKGNCYSHVEKTYKFYLSLENSLCTDYVTEKFFNALESEMVPVVYGGAKSEDYAAIAPKYSYIDSRDFASPKELAAYLMQLDQNDEEYLKYFEWKNKWRVEHSPLGWCNLCQRLYEHRVMVSPPEGQWYRDLWKWWNYMSYDTQGVVDDISAQATGQSYFYKMGALACEAPPRNFTGMQNGGKKLDLEPGIWNGKIFGKLVYGFKNWIS